LGKFYDGLGRELSLFVRQLAWLNTVPNPPERKGRSRKSDDRPKAPRLTRLQQMEKRKERPEFPPISARHIVDWLMEVGPVEMTGMDRAAVSWREMAAWQKQTGRKLAPWQARLIRRLSNDYLIESRAAEDSGRPAPWRTAPSKAARDAEEAELRAVLG
jgi:hypothetical protein